MEQPVIQLLGISRAFEQDKVGHRRDGFNLQPLELPVEKAKPAAVPLHDELGLEAEPSDLSVPLVDDFVPLVTPPPAMAGAPVETSFAPPPAVAAQLIPGPSVPAMSAPTITPAAQILSVLSVNELRQIAREVMTEIAWEVVPQLAEAILREEIEKLVQEKLAD